VAAAAHQGTLGGQYEVMLRQLVTAFAAIGCLGSVGCEPVGPQSPAGLDQLAKQAIETRMAAGDLPDRALLARGPLYIVSVEVPGAHSPSARLRLQWSTDSPSPC
jgi:hypothetical protein